MSDFERCSLRRFRNGGTAASKWETFLVVAAFGGGELNDRMERYVQINAFLLRLADQISIKGAECRLMSDDQDRRTQPFEFDNHRFQSLDDIRIRLALRIAITELIGRACGELLWHAFFDLFVGQAVAYPGVDLVECAKHLNVRSDRRGRGDGPLKDACPDDRVNAALVHEAG